MTLVNKIIHVSAAQSHHTWLVHCICVLTTQVMSPSSPFIPPIPSSTPPAITTLLSMSISFFSLFTLLCSIPPPPQPPSPEQPPTLSAVSMIFICESVSILLVHFVHWVPHMSEIIWYLSFSDWIISLSILFSRSIHAVAKGKISFFSLIFIGGDNH